MSAEGVQWSVVDVVKVVDGDTVHMVRERLVDLDGRRFMIRDAEPVSIRLVWIDTPERGDPAWRRARDELVGWVANTLTAPGGYLEVVCYESGGWDRIMGDLLDHRGSSASQWLMQNGDGGLGWPAYVPR